MGTSALGGFATGLMQGMEHTDTRRRNKAIDNILDRNAYEQDLDYEERREKWAAQGNDIEEFPEFKNPAMEDPWLVKGFNWLKSRMGYGEEDPTYGVVQEEPEEADADKPRSALPPGRFYADGGRVDGKRMKRSYGDYYVTEDEAAANRAHRESLPPRYQSPTSPYMREQRGRLEAGRTAIPTFTGSGPGIDKDDFVEAGRDIKNAITGSNTYRSLANLGPVSEANVRNIGDANSPEAAGEAVRHSMVDAGAGALNVAGGVASDVVEGLGLDNVPGFVRGFVGRGTRENPQPYNEYTMPDDFDPNMKLGVKSAIGDDKTSDQVADEAIEKGVAATPGHPDNPDQAIDWADVRRSGARPEDIPNMTVKDWTEYRRRMGRAAALGNKDVQQVQMDITKMQMQGAMSNMQQAAYLLQAGDPESAELALRASFQYFPNGSDVKFGIYDSEQGPVLVGMGFNEETGEPVGVPMALTPEKLFAMAANFNDPTAFNTWTKDWRDEELKRRKHEEIDKPAAQSEAIYRDRMGTAALQNADANLLDARARGRGASSVKESDFRESFKAQSEGLWIGGVNDEDLIDMNAIANRIRQAHPNQQSLSDDQIVKMVLNYYKTGDTSELNRYLGGNTSE